MKLIGARTEFALPFCAIGDFFTMGFENQSTRRTLSARPFVGVHYDTFPPIKLDHAAALKTAQAGEKELLLPKIGETIDV